MQIQITGKNVEISNALKKISEEKLSKIAKHGLEIMRIHLVFEVDKLVHCAKATIHTPGAIINAKADSENLYKAIDLLIAKINRQLRDHKK